jgi:hypothetical protein
MKTSENQESECDHTGRESGSSAAGEECQKKKEKRRGFGTVGGRSYLICWLVPVVRKWRLELENTKFKMK